MPKVSVVIPVYNVEPYIERCLHSLFNQTLKDIEYIFVNDCSSDASVSKIYDALNLYPNRSSQTTILNHTQNMGVAAARTTGIKAATGDYIIHCDPDDYIELDIYEIMYSEGMANNSDIVICGLYVDTPTSKRVLNFSFKGTPIDYLNTGIDTAFSYANLLNKLVRRSVIEKNAIFPYPKCDYGEDLGCVMRILYYAKSMSSINMPLYHYCLRPTSITGSQMSLNIYKTRLRLVDNICGFFEDKGFAILCNALKFNTKLEGRHLYVENEKEWVALYKECHKDIFKFSDNTLKARLIWWIALRNIWTYKLMRRIVKNI